MRKEIRIAGFGGQGIVLAGGILGEAAINSGHKAVQTQSYGPESRGGAARSEVLISDEKIDYPKVIEADILVALSQEAFDKFRPAVKSDGRVIIDVDLVSSGENHTLPVPFTKMADDLGRKVVANSIMLGYLVAATGVVSVKSMEATIREKVPKQTIDLNLEAFRKGLELSRRGRQR